MILKRHDIRIMFIKKLGSLPLSSQLPCASLTIDTSLSSLGPVLNFTGWFRWMQSIAEKEILNETRTVLIQP